MKAKQHKFKIRKDIGNILAEHSIQNEEEKQHPTPTQQLQPQSSDPSQQPTPTQQLQPQSSDPSQQPAQPIQQSSESLQPLPYVRKQYVRNWPPGHYVRFKLDNEHEYKLHSDCLNLIKTLKTCQEVNYEDIPLTLIPMDVNNRAKNSPPFLFHNGYILEFIENYFYEWHSDIRGIETFKNIRVQTGDPLAYLLEKDVRLFDDFKEYMWQIYGKTMHTNDQLSETIERKRTAIYIFGTMIFYFQDYLDCIMLANKMAIYIACMLHDSTLDEINAIMHNPVFMDFVKEEEARFFAEDLQ